MMKKMISKLSLILAVLVLAGCKEDQQEPWVELFDGTSLDGWRILGGDASYHVEDGSIVGVSVHDSPNTFLATKEHYEDFILEVDYKVHSSMNSGIQIRSNSIASYRDGRVHGYQVEIDPSDRGWTGGIYDESRRGWLFEVHDSTAQDAFKPEKWNTFRIEAIGDTIKTWNNGVPVAHLVDDMTPEGFIALQVHGIDKDAQAGTKVYWRNIRILTQDLQKFSTTTPVEPVRVSY